MKTVNDVLRLYYSTRCVIAHGVAAKTVIEGCLRDFPSVEELKAGMLSRAIAEEMWGLFQRLKQDGREVVVQYLELCMMYRFFCSLANRLMVAVAMGVLGISNKQPVLWKHTIYLQEKDEVIWCDGPWMMTIGASSPAVQPPKVGSQPPASTPASDKMPTPRLSLQPPASTPASDEMPTSPLSLQPPASTPASDEMPTSPLSLQPPSSTPASDEMPTPPVEPTILGIHTSQ